MFPDRCRRRRAAFTLMEVLLVLVILVILGSMSVTFISMAQKSALLKAAKSQIGLFDTPLAEYNLELNSYPTTAQGLDALRHPPTDLRSSAEWHVFLSKEVPLDPWKNPYQYQCPGQHNPETYDIWSFGPDGQNGTADDIGNW